MKFIRTLTAILNTCGGCFFFIYFMASITKNYKREDEILVSLVGFIFLWLNSYFIFNPDKEGGFYDTWPFIIIKRKKLEEINKIASLKNSSVQQ